MRIQGLKVALALSCGLLAVGANAATDEESHHIIYTPARGHESVSSLQKANITYHGGPTITSAKVVLIFWGPNFANAASPDFAYAQHVISFRNQYGTNGEYNVITQYSGIQLANLASGTADWFDTSSPPTNVTDTRVRNEVNAYLASHTFNSSTIYEVFIPKTSYSSSGGSTSCGGPNLAYCAYHSWTGSGTSAHKYSIQPYPSCSGCKVSGWSDAQNQDHFVCHETREAVTDPTGTGWYDGTSGAEADDKCAWSPTPFLDGGFGYQYEWSNANGGCVKTR